jgi:hypothetical protein
MMGMMALPLAGLDLAGELGVVRPFCLPEFVRTVDAAGGN